MTQIHKLSAVLSNQIAAGEVVERPASVVKELVENSIDADSKQIDVFVKGSGLQEVQVVDDGNGIAQTDIEMAFKRHATSKLNQQDDLFKINSLGFRGEALPSIASVADVTLKTSTGGMGTQFHVSGGNVVEMKPSESRRGTSVSVKNLFFNTPARLKYMKTATTELSKITNIVDQLALGHPAIAFSLVHDDRELMRTSGRDNLQQVIGGIYGINKIKKMLFFDGKNDNFEINGYTSFPELTRASSNYISIILNGRYVKNLDVSKAVVHGYGSKLMVGRYPITVLNIKTDPLLIDVNVHPTKQTVRISKENELCELISKTIFKVLSKQNLIPNVMNRDHAVKPKYNIDQLNMDLNVNSRHDDGFTDDLDSKSQNKESFTSSTLDDVEDVKDYDSNMVSNDALKNVPSLINIKTRDDLGDSKVKDFQNYYQRESNVFPFGKPKSPHEVTKNPNSQSSLQNKEERFPDLQYIGQMHGTYLLAEADDGMYILDQHAAQERINYEYYRQKIGEVSNDQQDLLVPLILEYSTTDTLMIKDHLDVFKSVGLYLDIFGKNSFIVRQHPTWFKAGQEEDTIREMIDWVLKNGKISVARFRVKTAIMMSCKRAIKANQHLDRKQAVNLIKQLPLAEDPFNCPHGRPVLVHFSNYDMEKMFKRIQDPH